jgi:hypothetical protein
MSCAATFVAATPITFTGIVRPCTVGGAAVTTTFTVLVAKADPLFTMTVAV